MSRTSHVSAALAIAVLSGACGDDDGYVAPDAGPALDAGPMGGGVCAPASGEVTITGQWAIRAALEVQLTERPGAFIQVCPDPQTTTASLVLKATIAGSGTSLTETVQLCDIVFPVLSGGVAECPMDPVNNVGVNVTLGSKLQIYLPSVGLGSTIALSSTSAGASFTPSTLVLVAGAVLASPMTDPLPRWDTSAPGCMTFDPGLTPMACVADLAAMRDHDTDLHFGVTLEAASDDAATVLHGSAYVALRVAPTFVGTVRNDNCIEGAVDSLLEFSLVDSNVILSGTPVTTPALINNMPVMNVLPTSTFRMLRADGTGANDFDDDGGGTVTCTEIVAHASAFGP